MKRRLLSLLLAATCVLSLVACGGAKTEEKKESNAEAVVGETAAQELSGEITFVAWGSDNEIKCDEKACEKFMELHPGTTVNFEALNDDYATTVETRYLGGQTPDVIYGHPQTLLNWIQQGMLMPLTDIYDSHEDLWDEEVYFTNLYDSYKVGDDYYAIPVGADTTVLYYNKDILDANGIAYPTADTTWEEFAEMCKKVTVRDADGVPTTLGLSDVNGQWMNILYSYGGKVLDNINDPKEVVFESEAALKMLNWIKDNYTAEGGFTASENDWTYLAGGFSAGEIAFMTSGVYDIVWLSDVKDFAWDIAPIPETMKEDGDTGILYAGYAVSNESKNPELAKEFAYFMASEEAQKIMGETGLITSCRKDVAYSDEMLKIEGGPEHHSLRVDTIPYGQNTQGQCLCWWEMTSVIDNEIYKMVHDEITPEEAMAAIQTQCSELLEKELNP